MLRTGLSVVATSSLPMYVLWTTIVENAHECNSLTEDRKLAVTQHFSVPPVVARVDVSCEITGDTLQTFYRRIARGDVDVLGGPDGPGEKRVTVASLERLVGRRLTYQDFQAAEALASAKRERRKAYFKQYHQTRNGKAA